MEEEVDEVEEVEEGGLSSARPSLNHPALPGSPITRALPKYKKSSVNSHLRLGI